MNRLLPVDVWQPVCIDLTNLQVASIEISITAKSISVDLDDVELKTGPCAGKTIMNEQVSLYGLLFESLSITVFVSGCKEGHRPRTYTVQSLIPSLSNKVIPPRLPSG